MHPSFNPKSYLLDHGGNMQRLNPCCLVTDSCGGEISSGADILSLSAKMQTRHIYIGGKRTTIALEQAFWRELDRQAQSGGQSWQRWIAFALDGRPANIGKARWLRVRLFSGGAGFNSN
jgi:predicted DNA-binding ribbon-helix-helix protein